MSSQISGSVGRWEQGAFNLVADVMTVQGLLKAAAQVLQASEIDPKGVDGKIAHPPAASDTVAAIEALQGRFTSAVDGLIGVGSQTWHALLEAVGKEANVEKPLADPNLVSSSVGFLFPFPTLPASDWAHSPRAFASNRNDGARAHAGCDLYFPKGTFIYAVGNGTVTRGPYPFYCETFALEIDHGDFVARYGEIQGDTLVRTGDRVQAGQRIAKVGHLVGISVPSDMLHFELYDKSASGPLTTTDTAKSKKRADGTPFMRRVDLFDPTSRLNAWQSSLPSV